MAISAYLPIRSAAFRGVSWDRSTTAKARNVRLNGSSSWRTPMLWSESRWKVIERSLMAWRSRLLPDRSTFPRTLPKGCDLRDGYAMDLDWDRRYRMLLEGNPKTFIAARKLINAGFWA